MTNLEWQFICNQIQAHTGISQARLQRPIIEQRVKRMQHQLKLSQAQLSRELLKSNSSILQGLTECFAVHESMFFRHPTSFDVLKENLLPEMIAQRFQNKSLRIWSAGCAFGQEAYSLALMLADSFPEIASWNIQILGTDISPSCIQKAQKAQYSEFEFQRGMPTPILKRYGRQMDNGRWTLDLPSHIQVEFSVLNLTKSFVHAEPFDLIVLRNVLIYFSPSTQRMVLNRVRPYLDPNGILLLGPSETGEPVFSKHRIDDVVYYRRPRFK